jgi:hypothetical protein
VVNQRVNGESVRAVRELQAAARELAQRARALGAGGCGPGQLRGGRRRQHQDYRPAPTSRSMEQLRQTRAQLQQQEGLGAGAADG